MSVKQLGSNRTEITVGDKTVLVSYSTPVAAHMPGTGYVRTELRHSRTTAKHITQWLDGATATEKPQSFFDSFLS